MWVEERKLRKHALEKSVGDVTRIRSRLQCRQLAIHTAARQTSIAGLRSTRGHDRPACPIVVLEVKRTSKDSMLFLQAAAVHPVGREKSSGTVPVDLILVQMGDPGEDTPSTKTCYYMQSNLFALHSINTNCSIGVGVVAYFIRIEM